MKTKLGQEIFAIPHGKNFIVYAPLQGEVVLCNAATVNLLQRLQNGDLSVLSDHSYTEVISLLRKASLLVNDEEPARNKTKLMEKPETIGFSPTRVTFLVTTDCNLRCVYCYASAGDQHITIPIEVCKAAIDLVIRNAASLNVTDTHIAFHGGGEPTTAFSLIRQCVEYAQKQAGQFGIKSTFSIVTNGILNGSQIKWLATNMNGISISLDGPEDIQNIQRPLRNGRGSFDKVISSIKIFEKLGVLPFIRATITNVNVGRMREISQFFSENFKTPEFQLEPVSSCGRCAISGYREPVVEDFVRGVEEAIEEASKHRKKAVCSAALETFPNLIEAYCGVAAPNFAITPQGIVTACYEVSLSSDPRGKFFYYGHYNQTKGDFEFDNAAIERLQGHIVQNIQRCINCFCRWQCAGDCPVRSEWQFSAPTNDSGADFRCRVTRELVKRRLVKALEEQQPIVN